MRKALSFIAIVVVAVVVAIGWQYVRNALPFLQQSPANTIISNLKVPDGFQMSVFADGLPGARVIVQDPLGNFWVSRPSDGVVTTLEMNQDGSVARKTDVFKGLNYPHGLALDGTMLYVAESNRISRAPLYSERGLEKIADLPGTGGHVSRTIAFGPDGRLYVSIGSSCNVCHEENQMRAKIFSMKKDGSDLKEVARGLRNSVFFTWSYVDGRMWATDMGRDLLGDDLPPDEINIIRQGKNYGWPNCYGKNIHDDAFDKNTYIRNPCMEPFEMPSHVDLQAHSAPLGLAFVPEEGWPEKYWHNLIVAYHGSWNRSAPTGYKLVRIKLDAMGKYLGTEDFITGWLKDGKAIGRPVDILARPGGTAFITDDFAGVIYKLNLKKPAY